LKRFAHITVTYLFKVILLALSIERVAKVKLKN